LRAKIFGPRTEGLSPLAFAHFLPTRIFISHKDVVEQYLDIDNIAAGILNGITLLLTSRINSWESWFILNLRRKYTSQSCA
jgi:hypothetical protein